MSDKDHIEEESEGYAERVREWRRQSVANHLAALAERMRAGHILSVKYEWDGGDDVSVGVTLAKTLDFIPISIHLLDRKEDDDT